MTWAYVGVVPILALSFSEFSFICCVFSGTCLLSFSRTFFKIFSEIFSVNLSSFFSWFFRVLKIPLISVSIFRYSSSALSLFKNFASSLRALRSSRAFPCFPEKKFFRAVFMVLPHSRRGDFSPSSSSRILHLSTLFAAAIIGARAGNPSMLSSYI